MKKLLPLAILLPMVTFAQNINFELSSQNLPGPVGANIATGDFNNDGNVDICVDGITDNSEPLQPFQSYIFMNNGDGTLETTTPFEGTAGGPVFAEDFHNDGLTDYAKFGMYTSSYPWIHECGEMWRNNGDGTFTNVTPSTFVPMYGADGVAEDFDNDGDIDIFIHGYNGTENIYKDDDFMGFYWGDMVVGDIDNDGWLDVIHEGYPTGEIHIMRNDQNGSFNEEYHPLIGTGSDVTMVLIDINHDGFLDLGMTGEVGWDGTQFFINDGTGNFIDENIPDPFGRLRGATMLPFDANEDGKDELFVSGLLDDNSMFMKLFKIDTNSNFTVVVDFPIEDAYFQGDAVAVDVNGDGHKDLFCSGNHGWYYPFETGKSWLYLNTSFLATQEVDMEQVTLYPNPTSGIVNLELPATMQDVRIALFNMAGQQIPVSLKENQFDISNLSSGVYTVQIQSGGKVCTKKLVKK